MGPRSAGAGFDEIEAGYAQQAEEEETREPAYDDQDEEEDETPARAADAEEDELALAEREYLNEMRTGMHVAEEDGIAI